MFVSLDALQRRQIAHRRQNTRDYRLAMRLSTVLWRDEGKTESDIAHLLGLSLQTARSLAASRTSWNPQCSSSD